jgi:hypothetical protein
MLAGCRRKENAANNKCLLLHLCRIIVALVKQPLVQALEWNTVDHGETHSSRHCGSNCGPSCRFATSKIRTVKSHCPTHYSFSQQVVKASHRSRTHLAVTKADRTGICTCSSNTDRASPATVLCGPDGRNVDGDPASTAVCACNQLQSRRFASCHAM